MKALIEKLATGMVENELPVIKVSENYIEINVEKDTVTTGSFTVESDNGVKLKGLVYSTSNMVTIEKNQFVGIKREIIYKVTAKNVEAGKSIKGCFEIVSNAGEVKIPYVINIYPESVKYSGGKVKTLKDFAELAQVNFDEACRIFMTQSFKKVFVKDNPVLENLYDSLTKNVNKELALEEFLIGSGWKQSCQISLSESDIKYQNLNETYADSIVITKSTWGYMDISVEVCGDFFYNCKEKISYDDFTGSKYEYQYLISANRLHKGVNKGKIIFKTKSQTLETLVTIINPSKEEWKKNENRQYMCTLTKMYVDLRMGKMSSLEWSKATEKLVDERLGMSNEDIISLLLKAQICINTGRDTLADELLKTAGELVIPLRKENIELYSLFIYVKTLQKRIPHYTEEIKSEIRDYYENGHDNWKMLWLLLYLDERYCQNKSLKYTMIKGQFKNGCTSPIMYFEALSVLNEEPGLLRIMNDFEKQVLIFGSKNDFLSKKLVERVVELSLNEKKFDDLIFNLLRRIYMSNPSKNVLEAICTLLIKGNKVDKQYFEWYERGVEADIKITKLYEYYVFSADENNLLPLNNTVYMYFSFSSDSIAYRQPYLYYNIIENKKKIPDIYSEFLPQIEKYALEQIRKGHINYYLAAIYNEVLKEEFIDETVAKYLPEILCTCEIICSNPDMQEVIVIHKETGTEECYPISDGRVCVPIYTKDPCVIFVDANGNRYSSIKYIITPLVTTKNYLNICMKYYPLNKWLMLHFAQNINRSIQMFQKIVEMDDVSEAYKKELSKEIISYHYENNDNELIDEYIIGLKMERLDFATRTKVMEIMISRGLYSQVYPLLKEYGYDMISPRKLARFCTRMIDIYDYEYHKSLVQMSHRAFLESKFDEVILEYLQRFFYGTTEEMTDIWVAGEAYECDRSVLEERILVQMLFEGSNSPIMFRIFESYFKKGIGSKIKRAVFTHYSYEYFVMGKVVNPKVFAMMETEFYNTSQMTDICRMAFVYNYSIKENLNSRQVDLCKKIVYKLADMNVVLDCFKKFGKWFEMPYQIADKTIVDYRTVPRHKVTIYYYIGNKPEDPKKYISEEMRYVYPGVFVKEMVLFYGDKMYYYFTETGDNFEKTTDVKVLSVTDKTLFNDENRFNMINHMLIADEIGKEDALKEVVDNFDANTRIVEELFKMV